MFQSLALILLLHYSTSISSLTALYISILLSTSILLTIQPFKLQLFINSSIRLTLFISFIVTTTPNLIPSQSFGSSRLLVFISIPQFLFLYELFGIILLFTFSAIYFTLSHFLNCFLASTSRR